VQLRSILDGDSPNVSCNAVSATVEGGPAHYEATVKELVPRPRFILTTPQSETPLAPMATRMQRKTVSFDNPFVMKGIDRVLPPGDYVVVTDEELVEGMSFPVYRRVSTAMMVQAQNRPSSVEMLIVDPLDLEAAQQRDAATDSSCVPKSKPATP
jgi:hypothetical protein